MRRLARRLFTLCSAVSLVLCVGFVGLWGAEGHLLLFRHWPHMPRWDGTLGFRTFDFQGYGTGWIIPCARSRASCPWPSYVRAGIGASRHARPRAASAKYVATTSAP